MTGKRRTHRYTRIPFVHNDERGLRPHNSRLPIQASGGGRLLDFLANNVEQLDVALEHALLGDANNARFALMMTDNAIEITLHQTAVDAQMMSRLNWYRENEYEHARELNAALGNDFRAKVTFACVLGRLDGQTAETIRIGHRFRNEVYHLGMQHEAVLPVVSRFYLEVACEFLEGYEPPYISYGSSTRLPPRATSHLGEMHHFGVSGLTTRYRTACASLGARARVPPAEFANGLADHLEELVEAQDTAIETIASGGPRTMTREEAIVDAMAGSVAFSERGERVGGKSGSTIGSVGEYVRWLAEHGNIPLRKDPIDQWRRRARSVREEGNRHRALKKYRSFMDQTAEVRSILDEAHAAVERYIDDQIQQWKDERHV